MNALAYKLSHIIYPILALEEVSLSNPFSIFPSFSPSIMFYYLLKKDQAQDNNEYKIKLESMVPIFLNF